MTHSSINFKISTKEKMHVIKVEELRLYENMTENFRNLTMTYLDKPVKNLVIDFSETDEIEPAFISGMMSVQRDFYENNASMVFCCFSEKVIQYLKENDLLDEMNFTPTESEAWDIVQMEEIERELF
ncbi:MAG: STAS domain-containing protein [Chitinophagaceae bacterium]|nr:STAS domain-containing protein [Chitinophagaceae bacterium]